MNKSNKKGYAVALGFLLVFLTYNLILFAIAGFSYHEESFWVSYVFMLIAFAAVAVTGLLFKDNGLQMKDMMFGFPILKHATVYIVAEFVLSSVFMLLDSTGIPWFISFSLQLILLVLYVLMAISCFMAMETVREVNTRVKDSTTFIKLLQADVETAADKATDKDVKKAFMELAEKVRFSDPMSDQRLFELEKQITYYVNEASEALEANDLPAAMKFHTLATQSLLERNRKCKALK